MKIPIATLIALLVLILVVSVMGQAQPAKRSAVSNQDGYVMVLASARPFAASQKDTLPIKSGDTYWAASKQTLNVGFSRYISNKITLEDSGVVYSVYDYKARDSSTWVTFLRDTMTNTANAANPRQVREVVIRSSSAFYPAAYDVAIRVIHMFKSSDAGVTNATYKSELLWKP